MVINLETTIEPTGTQGAADSRSFLMGPEASTQTMSELSERLREDYFVPRGNPPANLLPHGAIDLREELAEDWQASISTGPVKGQSDPVKGRADTWSWTLSFQRGAEIALLLCDVTPEDEAARWQYVVPDTQGILRRQAFVSDSKQLLSKFVRTAIDTSDLREQEATVRPKLEAAQQKFHETPLTYFMIDVVRYKAIGFIGIGLKDTRFVTPVGFRDREIQAHELPWLVLSSVHLSEHQFQSETRAPREFSSVTAQAEVDGGAEANDHDNNANSVRRDALRTAGTQVTAERVAGRHA